MDRIVKHSTNKTRIQYGKIIKLLPDTDGYLQVGLYKDGKCRKHKVHRLVAECFVDNKNNKPEVNHLDENKQNNKSENLEWCTRKENENWGTKQQRKVKHTDYKAVANKNSKRVIQLDSNGNTVKEWNSLTEIHRYLGYSMGNISMCCSGKYGGSLYGYRWEYREAVKCG